MIAFLTGTVRELRPQSAVVVSGGLGYEVFCPASTLGRLKLNESAELHTRLVVREDSLTLFGFADGDSLTLFDLLISVSGVGPKLALGLLSALAPAALAQGLLGADSKLLSSVSGVGKKTAERLVLELQNKVPEHLAAGPRLPVSEGSAAQDAVAALLALGFREAQVRAAVAELLSADPAQSADQLIRKSLGKLR